jgi:hypothetical protein
MAYVIYNKETTYILRAPARSVGCYVESYKSAAAAKAALTRLAKKGKLPEERLDTETGFKLRQTVKEDFAIAEIGEFRANIEKQVERTNLMSGEKYMEAVNTPVSCSPASETYWCS